MDDQDARHQLPMDIGEFTGRTTELDRLVAMTGGGAPLVVTVEGMAVSARPGSRCTRPMR